MKIQKPNKLSLTWLPLIGIGISILYWMRMEFNVMDTIAVILTTFFLTLLINNHTE